MNDSWHLLNYQTDNNSGAYILKTANIFKWKMPGRFSNPNLTANNWKFSLTTSGINKDIWEEEIDEMTHTLITPLIYARKNIV
jgi:hypothetical protein